MAKRRLDVLGILASDVACRAVSYLNLTSQKSDERHTRRIVVANRVPRRHARDGAGLAVDGGAAELGSLDPDELREVAPVAEARHVRAGDAIAGVQVELVVVPAVAGRLGDRVGRGHVPDVIGRSPHGQVLAIAAATNGARVRSVPTCNPNLTVRDTYTSWPKLQRLARVSA